MAPKLPNYLRMFRKRAYFTQDEVSFLLGTVSGTRVSRYEQFSREPGLETILAYGVIFAVPPEQLFAGLYERIEGKVKERATELVRQLEAGRLGPVAEHKLGILREIIGRRH